MTSTGQRQATGYRCRSEDRRARQALVLARLLLGPSPQTEIELLRRGFHIAYVESSQDLKPDRSWDAWYKFLTAKHALSAKPAFVGMSRGGEYAYTWATRIRTRWHASMPITPAAIGKC